MRFSSDTEECKTLLLRQDGFSRFQKRFFAEQKRERTANDLGYVSFLEFEDLRIAIIGLNSAWLSEGGSTDERQLLLGRNQVVDAIEIAMRATPHVIMGMQHHPFDFLKRFDQQSTQKRLEEACHLVHCGHLHQPDASQAVSRSGKCLTLAAGASFESRVFDNAYSAITLDPLHARTDVTFIQYEPSKGTFSYESHRSYPHEIDTVAPCLTVDLATAIERFCPDTADISHYLACLLLGDVTDVPIRTNETVAFGAPALLWRQNDSALIEATKGVLAVGRAVKLLHGHKSLNEILMEHGEPVRAYTEMLRMLGTTNSELREQITVRNKDAASLAGAEDAVPFRHTLGLLEDLLAEGDWQGLRELGERCSVLDDPVVATRGRRALALCLAQSSERSDRQSAVGLYRELTVSAYGEAEDWAALATLLRDDGDHEEAMTAVMDGIRTFPGKTDGFVEVGMGIVDATGDIAFRDELRKLQRERRGK